MIELQKKIEKLINDKEILIDRKHDIQNDTSIEANDKRTRLAILDFNIQDLNNTINAIEIQIRSQRIQEVSMEQQRLIDKKIREEEAKHIIPKQYHADVNKLKREQLQLEQKHEEIRERAKRLNTVVNEDRLLEQRRYLATRIHKELSFLATTEEIKRELTRIFNIRF